jgi:hypothetical protein
MRTLRHQVVGPGLGRLLILVALLLWVTALLVFVGDVTLATPH